MTITIQPARTITDGLVMSKEAFLEVRGDVPLAFADRLNRYIADGTVTIMTASVPPAPDCRTCANRLINMDYEYWCNNGCTNGDQYEAAPRLVLWRTET